MEGLPDTSGLPESIRFAGEFAQVLEEFGGPVDTEPWLRSLSIPDPTFRFAIGTYAEGMVEGAEKDDDLPEGFEREHLIRYTTICAMAAFQAGVEWGRRYAPERQP